MNKKRLIRTCLAVVLCMVLNVTIFADMVERPEASKQITLNTPIEENSVGGGKIFSYVFTPVINGEYSIKVKTDSGLVQTVPVDVKIYDNDNNVIAESNERLEYQFLKCYMYANQDYYLTYSGNSGDVYAKGTITVNRVGNLPNSNGEDIITTDELWQIDEEISMEAIKEIVLDENKEINISIFGAKSVHKFIPKESGEYELTAEASEGIVFSVLNDNLNYINSGDAPFSISMEAGKTYIITSGLSDGIFGKYSIKIEKRLLELDGDIDADERVNAEDSLIVLKHAAKIEEISEDLCNVADINKDEKIDALDALEILKIAAKISE